MPANAQRTVVTPRSIPALARLLAPLAGVALGSALALDAGAQRVERSGQEVVETTCARCHATGENGAPRIGDAKAWEKRIAQSLTALTDHALNGIRAMPPHGGNPGLSDIEIERAIVTMVNASGGNWTVPMGGATPAMLRTSEQVVQRACANCHKDGANGAPRIGDREAWVPRLTKGIDALLRSAVHGHGPMPARGGVANLSDVELMGAIVYMFNYGVAVPTAAAPRPAVGADPYHKVADGADVYLGVMPAKAIPAGQRPGKAPSGKAVYHINISLFDTKTHMPITDAKVTVKVADPLGGESRTLDVIAANNTVSYGGYFRMPNKNPYTITAQFQRPGVPTVAQAQFDYKAR